MNKKISIQRLIECRKALGITKQEAAKLIGISQPAYLRYESGERSPSVQIVKEIALAFNTSVEYLMGESDNKALDTIVITKNNQPELFQIVSDFQRIDSSQLDRLKEYLNLLTRENNSSSKVDTDN